MTFRESFIKGVFEIMPRIFEDERGIFFEAFQAEVFAAHGIQENFVQDNQSFSYKGVLRGLHLQKAPDAQAKLVCVMQGSVLDVVVDVRPGSPTFGQYDIFHLDTHKHNRVFVPAGLAHGFITLEDAIFTYKCGAYYNKAAESGILWNDPTLRIDWGNPQPIVSAKDQLLPTFEQFVKEYV
ncbi:MAG: dTDP-4-dehydrorhamnose 3,5-epimerase [Saprospiraceae bacterium]|nr:dTDP-4-dehydrorhamnose 3,5-epimerase [Saprospiraceae bacterium]